MPGQESPHNYAAPQEVHQLFWGVYELCIDEGVQRIQPDAQVHSRWKGEVVMASLRPYTELTIATHSLLKYADMRSYVDTLELDYSKTTILRAFPAVYMYQEERIEQGIDPDKIQPACQIILDRPEYATPDFAAGKTMWTFDVTSSGGDYIQHWLTDASPENSVRRGQWLDGDKGISQKECLALTEIIKFLKMHQIAEFDVTTIGEIPDGWYNNPSN